MDEPSGAAFGLSVDHALSPMSLGATPSRLFWQLPQGPRVPQALEVEAASSERLLAGDAADVWKSGRVPYLSPWLDWPADVTLGSRSEVWWRVRIFWDREEPGAWSAAARFAVALVEGDDWQGAWITHPAWSQNRTPAGSLPVLVRDFALDTLPEAARFYITASGVCEAYLNGQLIGDALLGPGYSDPRIRHPAQAWDVTQLLELGVNRLAVRLGTGISWVDLLPDRYTKLERHVAIPRLLAQLELASDARWQTIGTDASWIAFEGDDLISHWYGGADQRGRVDPLRFTLPGVAINLGVPACVVGLVRDFGRPWWTATAPIRVVDRIEHPSVTRLSSKTAVLDFGTNVAGQLRGNLTGLRIDEPITFRPSELLHADGTVDQRSTGSPIFDRAYPTTGSIHFAPTLTYHGFRYVQVEGIADDLQLEGVSVDVIRADLPAVGTFRSSDTYLNTLHRVIDRAVQSNMFSVFTDCPHREKLGWSEQLYLCFDVLARSYDVSRHLAEQLVHIRDSQLPSGMVPSTSPELIDFSGDSWRGDSNAFRDDPNWGAVIAILPWRLYRHYGDIAVLAENWEAMQRYARYLRGREVDGIVDFGLGDWVAIDTSTPRSMLATFGYHQTLDAISRVGSALGETAASGRYRDEARRVLDAFRREFGPSSTHNTWGSGSQGSLSLSLDVGAVPADKFGDTFKQLVAVIRADGDRFTVGENALPSLLRVLSSGGRDDLIDTLARGKDGPGYAHQIASGATALTESWQGPQAPNGQASQNHFMLGAIDGWLTSAIGGLAQAPESVGWQEVLVSPRPLAGLESADVHFNSPSGPMSVRWNRDGETRVDVEVCLPQGVSGELRLSGTHEPLPSGVTRRSVELSRAMMTQ